MKSLITSGLIGAVLADHGDSLMKDFVVLGKTIDCPANNIDFKGDIHDIESCVGWCKEIDTCKAVTLVPEQGNRCYRKTACPEEARKVLPQFPLLTSAFYFKKEVSQAPGWNGVSPEETCGMHFTTKTSMINTTCTLTGSNIDYVFAGNGAFVVGKNANSYVFTGYEKLSTSADLIVFFKQDYGMDGRTMDNSTCWDAQLKCTEDSGATGGVFFMENVNDHRHEGKASYNLLISGVSQGDVLSIQLKSNGGEGWKAQNVSAPFGNIMTNEGMGVSNDGLITVEVADRPFGQLFELSVTRQAGEEYNLDLWSSTVTN